MIFASDLDRTLIYSEKFLQAYDGQVKVVESGRYTSLMTQRATELLHDISRQVTFVPCTTRTIEQYQRIQFFQQECVPQYTVVSNGGNLIVDGVIDQEYRKNINRELKNCCLSAPDLLKEFDKFASDEWANPLRNADELFYYCIVDRAKVPTAEMVSFSAWVRKQNWEMSIQGRKLYLIPAVINKWTAIEKIKQLTGENIVFAAGDSLLDLPMIFGADYSIYPTHGEIYETYGKVNVKASPRYPKCEATERSGMIAAEEILEKLALLLVK